MVPSGPPGVTQSELRPKNLTLPERIGSWSQIFAKNYKFLMVPAMSRSCCRYIYAKKLGFHGLKWTIWQWGLIFWVNFAYCFTGLGATVEFPMQVLDFGGNILELMIDNKVKKKQMKVTITFTFSNKHDSQQKDLTETLIERVGGTNETFFGLKL